MTLENLNVVCFESRHADTMANLVRRQGGRALPAPCMKEVPLENNPHVFSFGQKLFAGEIDVLILLTGVGVKSLVAVLETKYSRPEILEAFRKITLVPRGPKPVRVLNEWKIPFAVTVPEPNTWRELLQTLDEHREKIPLKGRTVAVQEYGVVNDELVASLRDRGANVLRVPVYRWELPDDLQPLKKAIEEIAGEKIEVAIFTTAVQIEHVLRVAASMGLDTRIREAFQKMAVASVGPDCSEALRAQGVSVDIEPESPKMGPLVLAAAQKAQEALRRKKNFA